MSLLVMESQEPYVGHLKSHIKPEYGYREIIVSGSRILPAGESRAFLKSAGIVGEIVPTPRH